MVSSDPNYGFTSVSNRALVANFAIQPALRGLPAAGGALELSWPAGGAAWVLQESPDLDGAGWVDSTRPVSVANGRNQVVIPAGTGTRFFRLLLP
jgi:hypothetical protein